MAKVNHIVLRGFAGLVIINIFIDRNILLRACGAITCSGLFDTYKINHSNWQEYQDILFDINNVVTLAEQEHKQFHKQHGKVTTPEQFTWFRDSFQPAN